MDDADRALETDDHHTIEELLEMSRAIGLSGRNLEARTAAALIIENRKYRRTNWYLGVAMILLLASNATNQFRSWFVTGPKLEDAGQSMIEIETVLDQFVEQLKKTDGSASQQEEIQKAIFDVRRVVCIKDPDACQKAGLVLSTTTATTQKRP